MMLMVMSVAVLMTILMLMIMLKDSIPFYLNTCPICKQSDPPPPPPQQSDWQRIFRLEPFAFHEKRTQIDLFPYGNLPELAAQNSALSERDGRVLWSSAAVQFCASD